MGNAFTANEVSSQNTVEDDTPTQQIQNGSKTPKETVSVNKTESWHTDGELPCDKPQKTDLKESGAPKESLLRSLLSRFERGFEFDDLLLLGLILLLLQGGNADRKDSKDEMILILAFLFLTGF